MTALLGLRPRCRTDPAEALLELAADRADRRLQHTGLKRRDLYFRSLAARRRIHDWAADARVPHHPGRLPAELVEAYILAHSPREDVAVVETSQRSYDVNERVISVWCHRCAEYHRHYAAPQQRGLIGALAPHCPPGFRSIETETYLVIDDTPVENWEGWVDFL